MGGEVAPVPYNEEMTVTRKQWKISQTIAQQFWKRWINEYLPTLCQRKKWNTPTKPIEVGDVVLITDENTTRDVWLKGIIVEVNKAKDGQVRSAKVKTIHGIYTRPVVKLAILDVKDKRKENSCINDNKI
jgi:hypothetical protein